MNNEVREKTGVSIKNRITAKRIALIGIFVALSYVVSFLEIPMPILGANFLKLDFGNIFILLISFLLGPVEGVIVCFLKESLRLIGGTVAGELANFIMTTSFILLPSLAYQKNRKFKTVVWTLSVSIIIATLMSLIVNRIIIFPAFEALMGSAIWGGLTVDEAFAMFWPAIAIFNLIKMLLISIITILLYKRMSNTLKRFNF